MEYIKNVSQFKNMIDNKIVGIPELINSEIIFKGKNNILAFNDNITLENVVLNFNGNNSIVYLGSDLKNGFSLVIYNDSTCFLGNNLKVGANVSINLLESENVIIGDECVLKDNVYVSNSDGFSIYNIDSKNRINFSKSIFIGDHVFLGNNVYVSKGVKIGSGSVVDNASFIPSYAKISSNMYLSGNPAKIIQNGVFFTNDFVNSFSYEDSLNSKNYRSDIFIFKITNQETLSLDNIDSILKDLDVESRLDFIEKLFLKNKRKNRFSI